MAYFKFSVTLIFGGEFCPMLPRKRFVVDATDGENAIQVATSDAIAMGYKRGWIVGHTVEVL
jgi:hypothetical protein